MNCHNCAKYLSQALDSVYQQTFKDYEIIFWDNQSTDNSGKIALSYRDPIRYFRGEVFLPLGAARNAAIKQAKGRYIAFLDCDDIWLPEKLERQVELLESNQELSLVYSDSYVIDSDGNLGQQTYFHGRKPFKGAAFVELLEYNPIVLSTAVVRREVLNTVGIFNPEYKMSEEYDLWLRIAEYYPVDFIESPLAKYRVHSESASQRNVVLAYIEDLQILDYWLTRKQALTRELRDKVRRQKTSLCRTGFIVALSLAFRNRNAESVRDLGMFARYLLLPKHQRDYAEARQK